MYAIRNNNLQHFTFTKWMVSIIGLIISIYLIKKLINQIKNDYYKKNDGDVLLLGKYYSIKRFEILTSIILLIGALCLGIYSIYNLNSFINYIIQTLYINTMC